MHSQWKSSKGYILAAAALAVSSLPAAAASFEFNTLVRLGSNGNGGGSSWEFGVGNNTGAPSTTSSLSPNWNSGASRQFQITYSNPTNTLEMRMFSNNGSNSDVITYTPAGGPAGIGTTWTLPATSFFVTALTGANVSTSINLSSMTLTGLSGALTILSPMQQTSLVAQSGFSLPTSTVRQSQNIVFQGDATGSWRLAGFVTMNFSGLGGSGGENLLQFGLSASAADVTAAPEPSSWALMLTGFALVGVAKRRGSKQRS